MTNSLRKSRIVLESFTNNAEANTNVPNYLRKPRTHHEAAVNNLRIPRTIYEVLRGRADGINIAASGGKGHDCCEHAPI